MINETWKPIGGYEGLYEVSDKGRIRSVDRIVKSTNKGTSYYHKRNGALLKPYYNRLGYLLVELWKEGIGKAYTVHRLVALAFVPNPYNKPCVNHLDETHDNNCADNLEWCTQKENMNYGTAPQRIGSSIKRKWERGEFKKRKCRRVAKLSQDGTLLETYSSYLDATRACGSTSNGTSIINCIHGKCKTAYGYKWSYCDSIEGVILDERKD